MSVPNVLSIAGSDPSGGAGIQADLKTFAANGVYGMAAITALTAQNSRGVIAVEPVSPAFVATQIDAVFADIRVDAVKIGMLGTAGTVAAVADTLARHRPPIVVLDPVLAATTGPRLLEQAALAVLRDRLLPLVDLLTPNLAEAGLLLGVPAPGSRAEMEQAARRLIALGPRAVLLKGGHLRGAASPDHLATPAGGLWLEAPRLGRGNVHGTGCTLSAALAAQLALGRETAEAARRAKAYTAAAIAGAGRLSVGRGDPPPDHFSGFGG